MKDILLASGFVTPVICLALAGILAWKDKNGWGWFLFVAVVIAGGMSANIKAAGFW